MSAPAGAPVVVGVGTSPLSLSAVRLAASEASAHHRPLTVMHAFNWSADATEPTAPSPRAAAEELIDRAVKAAVEVAPGLDVHGEIAEGPMVGNLVRHSETAALVVLGDGHLPSYTCVPWDVPAIQVAARAGSPVLVVREEPPPPGPVLAGVDGSASGEAALAYAFGCAEKHGVDLLAVWVNTSGRPEDEVKGDLAEVVARRGGDHPEIEVHQEVLPGEPSRVLVEQSRRASRTVVGARGEEPWRGMLGEVTQSLLYHSPAPVLVVRSAHVAEFEREQVPPIRDPRP